jgi:hypothetical protein
MLHIQILLVAHLACPNLQLESIISEGWLGCKANSAAPATTGAAAI